MNSHGGKERISVILVAVLFVGLCSVAFVPAEEDAFIYYRYALNFSEGKGLVFNPNEWVEGYSSFLWMWILVFLATLKLDLPMAASLLSIFLGAATIGSSYILATQMKLKLHGRLATTLAVALFYPLIWWSRSGLETSCYTFLLTSSSFVYLSVQKSLRPSPPIFHIWRRHAPLGILIFLVSITRPEGILLALVVAVDRWLDDRDLSGLWRCLYPVLVGYCVFLIVRYGIYGSLTPNTSIKFNPYNIKNGLYQACSYFLYTGILPIALPIVVCTCGFPGDRDERHGFRFLVLTVLVLSVFFTVFSGGDYRDHYRFLVPTFPLVIVLFVQSMQLLSTRPTFRVPCARIAPWVGLLVVLMPSLFSMGENLSQDDAWSKSLREWRDPLDNTGNYHVIAARWILENVPSGQVVAFGQMGKTPYYSLKAGKDHVFVDTLALLDAGLARILSWKNKAVVFLQTLFSDRSLGKAYAAGREVVYEQAIEYLLDTRRPDIFIVESVFLGKPLVQSLMSHPKFRQMYSLKANIPSETSPIFLVYARSPSETGGSKKR